MLSIFVSVNMQRDVSDCPDISGCQGEILEGLDGGGNIVRRNSVHLGRPAGFRREQGASYV